MCLFCLVHGLTWVKHNVHPPECVYGKRTLCASLFPCPLSCGPQGLLYALDHTEEAEWCCPSSVKEGPCLAGSRTALTGYHRRNCGFCPALLYKKRGKKRGKKAVSKGLGRVFSFSTDARTVCSSSLEAHIYNGAYLTLWHHQRACCVGLPGCSVGFVPLQQQQHVS